MLEPSQALGQVAHYIHLNPVRAELVEPEQAVNYPSSSLSLWQSPSRPLWLEAAVVLGEAGELRNTAAGWRKYLEYIEFLATDPGKKSNWWPQSSAAVSASAVGSLKTRCGRKQPSVGPI